MEETKIKQIDSSKCTEKRWVSKHFFHLAEQNSTFKQPAEKSLLEVYTDDE